MSSMSSSLRAAEEVESLAVVFSRESAEAALELHALASSSSSASDGDGGDTACVAVVVPQSVSSLSTGADERGRVVGARTTIMWAQKDQGQQQQQQQQQQREVVELVWSCPPGYLSDTEGTAAGAAAVRAPLALSSLRILQPSPLTSPPSLEALWYSELSLLVAEAAADDRETGYAVVEWLVDAVRQALLVAADHGHVDPASLPRSTAAPPSAAADGRNTCFDYSAPPAAGDTLSEIAAAAGVTLQAPLQPGAGGRQREVVLEFGSPSEPFSLTLELTVGDAGESVVGVRLVSLALPGIEADVRRALGDVVVPMLRECLVLEAFDFLRREFPESDTAAPGMEEEDADADGDAGDDSGQSGVVFDAQEYVEALGELSGCASSLGSAGVLLVSYGIRNGGAPPQLTRVKDWTRISALCFNSRGRNLAVLRGTDPELQQRLVRLTSDFAAKFRGVLNGIGTALRRGAPPTFGVFCSKGHHRSVALAELIAQTLRAAVPLVVVETRHPHIHKR